MKYWRTRSPGRWFMVIGSIYFLLAVSYGIVTPLFEAPDEIWHYFTVDWVAATGRLPQVTDPPDPWLRQEAAQPPLYYFLGAAVITPIDTGDARAQVWANPHVRLGDASFSHNINAVIHTDAESWPWTGYVLAAHLLRLLSSLLGLGTLLCLYVTGRHLWPDRPARALLATALIAFLPQFTFLHGSISNDPLVIFGCSLALWQLIRLTHLPAAKSSARTGAWLLLGVTIGLTALTKLAGFSLLAFTLFYLVLVAWRRDQGARWRRAGRRLLLVAGPALLLSGWLLVRNWLLYGDPTATNQFIAIEGRRTLTVWQALGQWQSLWPSLLAVFGWFNVRAPDWVFGVWTALSVAGAGGGVVAWYRGRRAGQGATSSPSLSAWGLALWAVIVYLSLLSFMMRTPAAQGRLLFPAILPLGLGVGYGLSRWPRPVALGLVPLLALLANGASLTAIPPAYARPPASPPTALPAAATPMDVDLIPRLRLAAAELSPRPLTPGDTAQFTLYWQALAPPAGPLSPITDTNSAVIVVPRQWPTEEVVLELLGRNDTLVGKYEGYHGGGLWPATLWPLDAIIVDEMQIRLDGEMTVPTLTRLQARLTCPHDPPCPDTTVDLGFFAVYPASWPATPATTVAVWDEGLALTAVSLPDRAAAGETITIEAGWRVDAPTARRLTTFVQLGPAGNDTPAPPLASGDRPPLNDALPTDLWPAGAVLADEYTLTLPADLPAGRYPIWLGLYDETGRAPLRVDGIRPPADAFLAGWVSVDS